jgi:hypothetical protein
VPRLVSRSSAGPAASARRLPRTPASRSSRRLPRLRRVGSAIEALTNRGAARCSRLEAAGAGGRAVLHGPPSSPAAWWGADLTSHAGRMATSDGLVAFWHPTSPPLGCVVADLAPRGRRCGARSMGPPWLWHLRGRRADHSPRSTSVSVQPT